MVSFGVVLLHILVWGCVLFLILLFVLVFCFLLCLCALCVGAWASVVLYVRVCVCVYGCVFIYLPMHVCFSRSACLCVLCGGLYALASACRLYPSDAADVLPRVSPVAACESSQVSLSQLAHMTYDHTTLL